MKKLITFQDLKKIQRAPLRDFNRWLEVIYESGKQNAIEEMNENVVAEVQEDELMDILLSVKGIGQKRADEIMRKILKNN